MKGTLHRGSACPPAGGGREDDRCLKHTQPLRERIQSSSVSFPIGSVPSASVRSSSQPRLPRLPKIQTEVNWARRPPRGPQAITHSKRRARIKTNTFPFTGKRLRSPSHCTVITGDGLFVVGLVRSSVWNKQHRAGQHF